MAQGDAYVYEWSTGTSTTYPHLTLTPSAGVEWMFVSSLSGKQSNVNGISMVIGTNTGTSAHYVVVDDTGDIEGKAAASGGPGWSTSNMKIIATNSSPMRYQKSYNGSFDFEGKFCAIVINE